MECVALIRQLTTIWNSSTGDLMLFSGLHTLNAWAAQTYMQAKTTKQIKYNLFETIKSCLNSKN